MKWLVSLLVGSSVFAQTPLSLTDAVRVAIQGHPAVEASRERSSAAQSRVREVKSGYYPSLSYSESYQVSNNPIFVFGSLLTQHQFTEQNFQLGPLNRPDALNNFQSRVSVDQLVFDAGARKAQVRSAEIGTHMMAEQERRVRMELIAKVTAAYFGAVLAKQQGQVAQAAVRSAEADLQRAQTVRSAGMSTDADVLSVRVHLAAMREREIRAKYNVETRLAALNEALGLPLDTRQDLSTPLTTATLSLQELEAYDKSALQDRPEARQSQLAVQMAGEELHQARAALFPKVSVQGAFEADRQEFIRKGGANWSFSAGLTWNLFDGFASHAKESEAAHLAQAATAERKRAASEIRLAVRQAFANWKAAEERIGATAAAVDEAEESLRITKNRYGAGLNTVTDLLRNETAALETKTRHLEAIYDQRVAAANLELAAGSLSGDSDALK
jgi:outer membrane protein TolC